MFHPMENIWSSVKEKIKRLGFKDDRHFEDCSTRIIDQGASIKNLRGVDEGGYECSNQWNVLEFCITNI